MKKKYSMPESWIIELDAQDIVTTSSDIDSEFEEPGLNDPYDPIG